MLALGMAVALVAGAVDPNCTAGISRETSRQIYDALNVQQGSSGCVLDSVTTGKSTLTATWTRNGVALAPLQIVAQACLRIQVAGSGEFVIEVPAELEAQCPPIADAAKSLRQLLAHEPLAPAVGGVFDPSLYRLAQAVFLALFALAVALLAHHRPRLGSELIALFVIAVAARVLVRPAMANWYSDVLPATGPPGWMRFGPGSFAFDSLIRSVLPWGDTTLFAVRIIVGALAVPLLVVALREVALESETAVGAGLLLAVSPFHVRISASSSEHVLSATLTFALLASWLRATRTRDPWLLLLSLLLVPAAGLTRVESLLQVALIPLWSLGRDRAEGNAARASWRYYAAFAIVSIGTSLYAYQRVAIPSHHGGPTRDDVIHAARALIPQFGTLALQTPHWLSLLVVVSAAGGAAWMARPRPWLLARIALTSLGPFVLLGRQLLHDELLGARYFLFPLALFLVPAAYAWSRLLRGRAIGWAILTGASVALSWPAYAARYTFQDEYTFLRSALPGLPDGCVVYSPSMRTRSSPGDIDCCLDLTHSPLPLAFPRLQFRTFDVADGLPSAPEGSCATYYESATCSMENGPLDHVLWGKEIATFRDACISARRKHLESLSASVVSSRATNPFLPRPPTVGLYRWLP